jgi:hypothetical protein
VPLTAKPQYTGVLNASPVVTDQNAQALVRVLEFDFNALRPGMPSSIDQCFPANAVDFVAQNGM